jgi:phosphatidylglycerophosphate synthase
MLVARAANRSTLESGPDPRCISGRPTSVSVAADALSVVRLCAAAALPGALVRAVELPRGRWVPLALFVVAAASDVIDGAVARRAGGASRHGAVLDNGADLAFVLAGTGTGAALGLLSWVVPSAIVLAFGAYVVASAGRRAAEGGWRRARSTAGHAAGVLNYGLTGLLTLAVASPGRIWPPVLRLASIMVVAANLAALLERLVPRRA